MKRMLVFVLALPLFSTAQKEVATIGLKDSGIHFLENVSWQQVINKAKTEHKYIFVDCFATWCGPCKAMDKKTYINDSVGNIINQSFLSIKMQCDTSRNDGKEVRARYADAHQLITDFHIDVYPTFLFFSPDGKIVHKGIGYHSPKRFIELAFAAMDPNQQYFAMARDYEAGKVDYARLPVLAEMAHKFQDTGLFSSIAGTYVHDYLDQLPDSAYSRKSNFDILAKYIQSLSSRDKVFVWLAHHPEIGDSLMEKKGYSEALVNYVIYKEEVKDSVEISKRSGNAPDWATISRNIANEFGSTHVDKVILRGMMGWYEFKKDWENYCKIAIERIEKEEIVGNPRDRNNLEILNTFAFGIFQKSNDSLKLEKALSWSALTVGAIGKSSPGTAGAYMDTKANLLYKLGRKEEAISLETKASEISPNDKDIKVALQKMQDGKPTW